MKALILVGGFGTRLRPLTFSKPKPLVEFCNLPILEHQIAALAEVGVNEVVLAVSYRPEDMAQALKAMEEKYKIKLTVSLEEEPMGTAGPLALARAHLSDGEVFFVFNSDVTCEYPLKEMLEFHRKHGGEGTICVTRVDEPSKYGVVVHDAAGKIQHFVEKPQTFVGNHINAGLYCFSPKILDRIGLRPTSIEKEVFPLMADEGQLFALVLPGYWMDIGQPKDYLTGMGLHLAALRKHSPERLASGEGVRGNVLFDPTATVGKGCLLGPDVVVGPGCVVEDGVRLTKTTLLRGAKVGSHTIVAGSIIGWDSTLGRWCRVENGAVLGEDVSLADEKIINGAIILPHKSLKDNYYKPGEIVM